MIDDSFEGWWAVAEKYAADHPELGLWEFQVKDMASDWAWRCEGFEITPENIEWAYADWISGNNPYSVHTVCLDGYDRDEDWRRKRVIARAKAREWALSKGVDEHEVERFIDTTDIGGLYFTKDNVEDAYCRWVRGWKHYPESPHYIPLDPVNIAERAERIEELERITTRSGLFKDLFQPEAHEYGYLTSNTFGDKD